MPTDDHDPRAEEPAPPPLALPAPAAAARGEKGVSSIVEGRSKRCLYSSTSSRESRPR